MSRYIDADNAIERLGAYLMADAQIEYGGLASEDIEDWKPIATDIFKGAPSIDIVFCKECKHRPIKEDANEADYGFNVIAPNEDERCPCLVEDGWYSWIPKDDFYCGYGEREGE